MSSPGADLESLLIRQTGLSVIVQALLDTMLAKGLLTSTDFRIIRSYAMDLSRDLLTAASPEARAAGVRLGEEIETFLRVIADIPPDDGE